ncbi:MAG: hypothetical protein PHN89_05610, partial [Candidatus Pacebacteria bacterium]|nr:hypothetical protein [Candidatus Paceibacterota bacterium]
EGKFQSNKISILSFQMRSPFSWGRRVGDEDIYSKSKCSLKRIYSYQSSSDKITAIPSWSAVVFSAFLIMALFRLANPVILKELFLSRFRDNSSRARLKDPK